MPGVTLRGQGRLSWNSGVVGKTDGNSESNLKTSVEQFGKKTPLAVLVDRVTDPLWWLLMAQETLKAETSTEGHLSSGESKSSEIKTAPGGHQDRSTTVMEMWDMSNVRTRKIKKERNIIRQRNKEKITQIHSISIWCMDFIYASYLICDQQTCFHKKVGLMKISSPTFNSARTFSSVGSMATKLGMCTALPTTGSSTRGQSDANPNWSFYFWFDDLR